jgi:hypothetical protein
MNPKFDWYTASIPANPQVIIGCLENEYEYSEAIPTTPKQGYERAYKIARGEATIATIMWGGNTGPNVYASASGGESPAFAEIIRRQFPHHGLIRADVAIDFDEEGAWESLSGLAIATADKFNLKVEHHGDFHREQNGRTINIGSRTSAAYKRLYEKGRQLKLADHPYWVRDELEFKPKNASAKLAYASASPTEIWHSTKWAKSIWEALQGPSATLCIAPAGTIRQPSDDERALEFMAMQYGNALRRKLSAFGGDIESFGLFMAKLIAKETDSHSDQKYKGIHADGCACGVCSR